MTILRILWQLKWVFLIAGLVFGVWRWHSNALDEARQSGLVAGRAEVQAKWDKETAQEDADAIAAKADWDKLVAARDAEIKTLKEKQATDEAAYQTNLAIARKRASDITRGVTASVRANPHDLAVCSLSDDTFQLLNDQIDQTNATLSGEVAGTGACGLQGGLQGCGFQGLSPEDEGLRGIVGSLRLATYAVR